MRRIMAVPLILIGIGIVSYPALREEYHTCQQKKISEGWLADLRYINRGSDPVDTVLAAPPAQSPQLPVDLSKEMDGLLLVERIQLEVPILTGVTERNLNLAVASIENTGKPGEPGNYCIAGHRSRFYGKLFNRIDELAIGDKIVVQTRNETYVYRVTENRIVQPEDIQLLLADGQKEQITLVTCDYSVPKPYLRLIVKGEREPDAFTE